MLAELQSIFHLFAHMSSSKATPGNKYLLELVFLKGELAAAQDSQRAALLASSTPPRGVTRGMRSMNLTPPIPVLGPLMAGKINALEESMQNIKAQLIAKRVELGGVSFVSPAAIKAWIKTEALAGIAYVFFLDPHSFMNVGHAGGGNSAKQLGFQAAAAKARFSLLEEALVVPSYKFKLPMFFWKETKDSQKLPVCPTANAWDSRGGFIGV
jgi:hypothetical protein